SKRGPHAYSAGRKEHNEDYRQVQDKLELKNNMGPVSDIHSPKRHAVIMVGCFDTKEEDFAYLHSCLARQNLEIVSINTGVMGTTDLFPVTVEAERVAKAAGSDLSDLRKKGDRGDAIDKMGKGAARVISQLLSERPLHGIIGMGGGG